VPFEQDGWRDGAAIRTQMSARFAAELQRRRLPYVTVTGPHGERLTEAVDAIDTVLDKSWAFTDPRTL
jgi:nicotinamide riboside kinase